MINEENNEENKNEKRRYKYLFEMILRNESHPDN